jgi:hypothetical protein
LFVATLKALEHKKGNKDGSKCDKCFHTCQF